jgi:hypothetical protein
MGILAVACLVLFGLWKAEQARFSNYKVAQAEAVQKAQVRRDVTHPFRGLCVTSRCYAPSVGGVTRMA